MKEVYKQIEDVEKERKKSAINSIIQRINSNNLFAKAIVDGINDGKKGYPSTLFDSAPSSPGSIGLFLDNIVRTYDSIRFDFQKNTDVKPEDFDRLFPKISLNSSTFNTISNSLVCLIIQMFDMKTYCSRLL